MKLRRPTFGHAWLLALLLLLAQGVGHAHRVLHAPGIQAGWAQNHEAGGADCRLIDQLAHADVLCSGAASAPAVLPAVEAAAPLPPPQWAAGAPAAYLARAPPRG